MRLIIILSIFLISCAQKVSKETVDAHIKYLSSDELNGRYSLSEDIIKAETYIIDTYKKNGLKAFPMYPNYKHEFKLSRSQVDSSSIYVNGAKLENAIVISNIALAIPEKRDTNWIEMDFSTDKDFKPSKLRDYYTKYPKNHIFWFNKDQFSSLNPMLTMRLKAGSINTVNKAKIADFYLEKPDGKIKSLNGSVSIKSVEYTLTNTIAYLEGTDEKLKNQYVVFSGHHDHLKPLENDTAKDKIFNGADDDASGVTGVLTLAEFFSKKADNKRSIIFMTFTAEEIGLLGSTEIGKVFPVDINNVVAMANMELIGGLSKWGRNAVYVTGYERSDLFNILKEANKDTTNFKIYPDPYPTFNLFYRSDNASLARLGVPAHTFAATDMDNNKTYHQVSDDYKSMDVDNLFHVINGIGNAMSVIISGEKTPTRVTLEE
jgi:hypothetical protein